jgi:cytoplasmic iron level regulating protein YaaA (DUF328/UPF0246 family)
MKKIILISCVKSKLSHPAKARDLYISNLFRSSLAYAQSLKPDKIFILSAKYGLLELDEQIKPYELTLKTMPAAEVKAWSIRVLASLRQKADLKNDLFIFLAGDKYRKYLIPELAHYQVPLEGLSFGQQLHEMKRRV